MLLRLPLTRWPGQPLQGAAARGQARVSRTWPHVLQVPTTRRPRTQETVWTNRRLTVLGQKEIFFEGGDFPLYSVGTFVYRGLEPIVGLQVEMRDALTLEQISTTVTDDSGFASFREPPSDVDAIFVATVGGVAKIATLDRLSPARIDFAGTPVVSVLGAAVTLGFGALLLSLAT